MIDVLTVCAPDGVQGKRTGAVGSQLDLAPTVLDFAGLSEQEMRERYPRLKVSCTTLPTAITLPTIRRWSSACSRNSMRSSVVSSPKRRRLSTWTCSARAR